jgi:predicted proteasome-type protease
MHGYSLPTREQDPVHVVRTIGRLAQMVMELRDEYVQDQKPATLDQIERRLDELTVLREQLRQRRERQNATLEAADE